MEAESQTRPLVVAVDGPSGVGKSTTARRLAEVLGLPYLDTGAMYRALGLQVLRAGIDPRDEAAVARLVEEAELSLRLAGETVEVCLNGLPVGAEIRSPEVSAITSRIATHPRVRELMVTLQRRYGRELGGVLEGRDIGTVVFPETPFKFFLDAPTEVRVARRHRQLLESGRSVSVEEVETELRARDRRDRERSNSPLRVDSSYTVVDTSELSVEEVVGCIVGHIRG